MSIKLHTVKSARLDNDRIRIKFSCTDPYTHSPISEEEQSISFKNLKYAAQWIDKGWIFIGIKRSVYNVVSVAIPQTLICDRSLRRKIKESLLGCKGFTSYKFVTKTDTNEVAKQIVEALLCRTDLPIVCNHVKTPFYLFVFSPYSML